MSDSDSEYETEDNSLSFVLHNAAEAGDVETLEKMLGLAEPGSVPVAMAVLLRRLLNMGDANECTPLHLAIINAHPGCVDALLRAGSSPTKACDGNPPLCLAACLPLGPGPQRQEAGHAIARLLLERGVDPHDRDDGGRTALHWAAASGHTGLLSLLLSGAVAAHRRKLVALLGDSVLEGGLPPLERPEHILVVTDHDGFTALHLAAKFGHPDAVALLLRAATESAAAAAPAAAEAAEELAAMAAAAAARAAAEAEAAAAAAAAAEAEADGAEGAAATPPRPAAPPPPSAEALAALFPVAEAPSLYKIKTRSEGQTALQLAALHGRAEAVGALLAGAGQLKGLTVTDKKGRTAEQLARRRGHTVLAAALQAVAAGQPFDMAAAAATVAAADGAAAATAGSAGPGTVLLAPPDCLLHRTAPEPLARGAPEPPPENVNRLHVLTQPDYGILHNREFDGALRWRAEGVPPAAMVDVLKCHEWSYIRTVMQACEAIPDSPSAVGSLDMDTAISRHSMRAALAAAGAVCAAVDEVVGGKARNAFCAVRPPGHHAGPTGVVTNPNDAAGSHGFCLLSNVAIGAAYAMNVHRHAGIKRVAILDFDVHHGNGTQACVLNTCPTVRTVAIRTPYSEGVQRFPTYKPWMGEGDTHNILFASVQGYGKRGGSGWFYPGSGATADSTIATALAPPQEGAAGAGTVEGGAPAAPAGASPAQAPSAAEGAAAAQPATPAPGPAGGSGEGLAAGVSGAGAGGSGAVPEDPDGEFRGSYDVTVVGGPRVINVGVPGPGGKPRMWRRAWRDKILPALYNFKPDLIIVSAGFDAHKKEDLNLRYVGVTEYDYEWLTGQIVEVANACCGGRLVSVLEGGYNLRGGPVGSAFARSVAAHVRALAAPCAAPFEPRDAEAERAAEKAAEAKKAQRVLAAAGLTPLAAAKLAATATATPRTQPPAAGAAAMEVDAPAAGGGGDADEPSAKRRRRPAVDYAALNAQMEAEAAAAAGGSGSAAGVQQ